uniref:Myelin expression factor 2-like n=1 Tax=Sinocyclocheilus anshuiensis TaxID=1608454 RepID=A0A671P388_9TELE
MADAELTLDLTDTKHEETGDSPNDEGEAEPQQTQENTNGVKTDAEDKEPKEKSQKSHRYHPYKECRSGSADQKASQRNRVFISNIPYDMKWQAIKDLMREKVGEVTYVELFKDGEGKSRVSFRDEEFVKKAIEVMSKHDLNGRPLNIKEDPDGEHARRVLQRSDRMYGAGRGQDTAPAGINIPPSIANNPNIPPEIISALQAGRLGTTVFVANLDFKVGWKKLKEVFSMAGTVRRADVKEDKDGKSRGMGTVTFEHSLETVQAISMFNGQMLFDRQMHVKMDDKSLPPDDFRPAEKPPQLPRKSFVCLFGMSVWMGGGFSGMDCMGGMGGFGGRDMGPMGRMGDVYRSGMGGMDRDFGRRDMGMNRPFGDSFGGEGYAGMGNAGMGPMGSGLGSSLCVCVFPQLSYDLTWQKLKEKFSYCGQVMYAEIKMENGKSKGCGTVRFDSPESAEKACRMMNGTKINGREVDVRIDRTA